MVTNGDKTILEYKIDTRKKDLRTKFCKNNDIHLVPITTLLRVVSTLNIKIKDDRVIMASGQQAYEFKKLLEIK